MFIDFLPCDVCFDCGNETICPLATDGFQSECDIFTSCLDLNLLEVNEE